MSTADAEKFGLKEGDMVCISTEADSVEAELEVTGETCRRTPQSCFAYNGNTFGVNVNRMVKNTHRDRFAGTPNHRHVPCSVEKI